MKSSALVVAVLAVSAFGGGAAHASPGRNAVCNVPSTTYPTIQSAVNATACRTVRVAPGTYAENVSITRPVEVDGAQAGQDARSRRGRESTLTGNFTISANDVTIDGFTINGPAGGGTAALIMQNSNSGETIQNNVINNPGRAASITASRSTFRRNLVKNTPTAEDGFQTNSAPVRDVTIADNVFTGPVPASYNADITFIEGNANLTVAGNRSTAGGTLVAIFKTTGARITGNTVVGDGSSSAVYIGGGNNRISVTGNTISSSGTGVKVANDFGIGLNAGVTITSNTLRNNKNGVNVTAASDTVQVNRNSLTGNTAYGVVTTGSPVNATCNWWGAINGPGAVASGRGDKVSANVTYQPWLRLPGLTVLCR
ncbi:right-handed parallel beta-helix repeat-containing protein [Actinoplanes bogorensis]|uniref:Right-handed parallel beta-helix repeat-containing protein n=1 Tax=Paractinoplanes bogorensis TaxID=1610840 RepID=A0ABS5YY56_9ACTN|nr:right-handed parallel beta-helix repeat-containing protein [Actinoplanes bogorensis]MBU2668372.1 right-handed parallel beta-helix repeat-containing protein [Actinoplanes bogorensis]